MFKPQLAALHAQVALADAQTDELAAAVEAVSSTDLEATATALAPNDPQPRPLQEVVTACALVPLRP